METTLGVGKEVRVGLVGMDHLVITQMMMVEANLHVAQTAVDHPTEEADRRRVHLAVEGHQMVHRMGLAARGMVKTNLTKRMTQLFGKWRILSQSWRKLYLQRMETPGNCWKVLTPIRIGIFSLLRSRLSPCQNCLDRNNHKMPI